MRRIIGIFNWRLRPRHPLLGVLFIIRRGNDMAAQIPGKDIAAKNLVAAGVAKQLELQVSYAVGVESIFTSQV